MDVEAKLDAPLDDLVAQGRAGGRRPSTGAKRGSGPMRKGTLSSTSRVPRSSPYNTRPRPSARGRSPSGLRGARAVPRGPSGADRGSGGVVGNARVGRPLQRKTISVEDDPLSGGDYIKVGGGTVPRNLAGLVANQVQASGMKTLSAPLIAVGPSSVNQAIKGLAIARKALDDQKMDFIFMPSFVRLADEDLNAIQLDIERAPLKSLDQMDGMELRAAGSTEVKSLAGAVAKNARDSANSFITAVGANSVNQAVKAIAIARGYVNEESIDLVCRASIEEVSDGDLAGKSAVTIAIEPVAM